jgi:diguanylate cyclase (GGDEF)-like protein
MDHPKKGAVDASQDEPPKGEFTATGTTAAGDHTQIIETRPTGQTRAGLQMFPILQVSSGSDQGRIISLLQQPRVSIGRSKESTLVTYDPSCSRNHAEIVLAQDGSIRMRDLGSTNGTKLNGDRIHNEVVLKDGDRLQLGDNTILRYALIPEDDARAQMDVYYRATRDALTNAYNRRQFDEMIVREMAYLNRASGGHGLSVIIFDVDHFKKINDSFGHLAGDEVLREVGRRVPPCIRSEDVFARIGGEEFAVISRAENVEGVALVAERIRESMGATLVNFESRQIGFTVSAGYAFIPHKGKGSVDKLIATADESLYEAKRSGRNRVIGKILGS